MKNKEFFIGWEVLSILLLMLFGNGAFFSEDLIVFAIGGSSIILLSIVYRFITKGEQIQLNWLAVICWLIALSYCLTLWTTVSVEGSVLKMIEWFTYGLLLLLVPNHYSKNASSILRLFSVGFAGAHVALLLTIVSIPQGILVLKEGLSVSGMRLNGVLQYANATGAIAAMLFLYTLYAHLVKKCWPYVDVLLMSTLAFLLFMTESRGTLLTLAVCLVFGLFVMKQQLTYLLLAMSTLVAGAIAFGLIFLLNGSVMGVCLAIISLVGMSIFIEKFFSKWQILLPKWVIPGGILVFIVFFVGIMRLNILPESIQSRLTLTTLEARFVYMQDAWQALKEFWLFGAGGEAWQFVVYQYQSTGYVSNDIHMFLEQHWLETGIFGLIILLGALIVGLWRVYKNEPALLPVILILLLHSCIDFTLSYGLALFLLAVLFLEGLQQEAFYQLTRKKVLVPVALVTLLTLPVATLYQQGENAFQRFKETYDVSYLEQALEKNPYATRYYEAQATISAQPIQSYEKILKNEPRHAKYWFYAAQIYHQLGEHEKAISYFEKSLTYDRFDWNKYKLAEKALLSIGTNEALALNEQFTQQKVAMQKMAQVSKLKNQERENLLKNK